MGKLYIGIVTAGLILCCAVLAQAVEISGTVYFDSARTDPAPCSGVQLYRGDNCVHPDSLEDSQVADENGEYSFDPEAGSYSVIARWAIVFCTDCDTSGTDCGTRFDSDCENVDTDLGPATGVNLDYDDIDCECE